MRTPVRDIGVKSSAPTNTRRRNRSRFKRGGTKTSGGLGAVALGCCTIEDDLGVLQEIVLVPVGLYKVIHN